MQLNWNHPEMTVDKAQKSLHLSISSPDITAYSTANLNFSMEINPDSLTNDTEIGELIQNIVLSSDDNISDFDDAMSTDSDNENVPEIDYQEELLSRWYYYASFVYQKDLSNREIDGCENPDASQLVGGIINTTETDSPRDSDTIFAIDDTCDKPNRPNSENSIEQQVTDDLLSKTHYLTLDFSELVNESSVSEIKNFVPRMTDDNEPCVGNTEHCDPTLNSADVSADPIFLSCGDRTMSVIASSSICMDEFSLADSELDPSELMPNKKVHILRRTTTLYNLNATNHQPITNSSKTSNRLLKAMKSVKRSLTPTRRVNSRLCNDNDSDGQELASPSQDIQLHDRRTVVRKLRKFRDSFRRKDKHRIQTLAML